MLWIALLVIALFANYLYFGFYDLNLMVRNDSTSYIALSPFRTVGYLLFLKALGPLYPDAVAMLQLNLHFLACGCLGVALLRLLPWPPVAVASALLLAGHTALQMQALWLLSDPLFVTLLVALTAAMAMLAQNCTGRWALWVGGLVAAIMLVRPAGYFLFGTLIFLSVTLVATRRLTDTQAAMSANRIVLLAGLWGPTLLALLLASSFNASRLGVFSPQVIGGYSLFGHVAEIIEGHADSPHPTLATTIEGLNQPVLDARPSELAFPLEYQKVTSEDYNTLLWDTMLPVVREHVAISHPNISQKVAVSEVAGELARDAITRHPGWYVRHVAAHFTGMALPVFSRPRNFEHEVTQAVVRSNDLLGRSEALRDEGIQPSPPVQALLPPELREGIWLLELPWMVQSDYPVWLLTLLGVCTLVLGIVAVFRWHPVLCFTAAIGLSAAGYMLLVALVQVALYRYTLAAVPMTLVFTLIIGGWTVAGLAQAGKWVCRRTTAGETEQG